MNFEVLENFEWLNEPENVRFDENAMQIFAKPKTDFWQSVHRGIQKDNGHFFFCRQNGDFILTLKWKFETLEQFSQCGLMLRVDERNWFKVSVMKEMLDKEAVVSSFTINGHSDWAGFDLNKNVSEVWFRLQRVDDDYTLFYSLDGAVFERIRMFYMTSYEGVKVGAYIACPNDNGFCAELSNIHRGI